MNNVPGAMRCVPRPSLLKRRLRVFSHEPAQGFFPEFVSLLRSDAQV
jgi:hypothetical protein